MTIVIFVARVHVFVWAIIIKGIGVNNNIVTTVLSVDRYWLPFTYLLLIL